MNGSKESSGWSHSSKWDLILCSKWDLLLCSKSSKNRVLLSCTVAFSRELLSDFKSFQTTARSRQATLNAQAQYMPRHPRSEIHLFKPSIPSDTNGIEPMRSFLSFHSPTSSSERGASSYLFFTAFAYRRDNFYTTFFFFSPFP